MMWGSFIVGCERRGVLMNSVGSGGSSMGIGELADKGKCWKGALD
jgi:hypothetical protein